MFLATSCLFTLYVYRVTLVMPDLQFMFTVPLTLGCLEKRNSDSGLALGDGLLQEVFDSSEDEGSPRKS